MKKLLAFILSTVLVFSLCTVAFAADTEKPFDNSGFYSVGDYTLHYRTFEPETEASKQILLIHGFCLSTASLEGVAEEYMKEGCRVVLVDAPNFGYSSRETSKTVFLSREEVIGSLMENLGGKWIVGGHSMGGGIAINLATDYPDTVTGLVLFAPQTSNEATATSANTVTSRMMQMMYRVILSFCLRFPALVRIFVSASFSDGDYARDYDITRITDPLSVEGTGAGISIMAMHTRGTDFAKLKALDIPCAIITASNDKVASAENLQMIIDNAPEGAVVYNFEKGGHMMMEYSPVEVAEKTMETIEKA